MFKTTQQDFYNQFVKTMSALPKTPEDVKTLAEKVKNVYMAEAKNVTEAIKTYQKAATGDATVNEITDANRKAKSATECARFAAFMTIPGAIFMIPALSKIQLELGAGDFVPDRIKQEFDLQ